MHEGQVLHGRYRLVRQLGEGGMGDVWLARDTDLPRDVAIKGVSGGPDTVPGKRRRLELEGETIADLDHEHIVPIIDSFVEDNQIYLVMKYVRGQSLAAAIKDGALTREEKGLVLADVLEALTYLHTETKVVHRDLTPGNVLLDQRRRAHLTDFGIALSLADMDRTRSAFPIGTLPFMAPEVRSDKEATAASDVWSIGAVALQLFTGRNYDDGIPDGDFAGPLTAPIRSALNPDPSKRPTAAAMLQSIRSLAAHTTRTATPTAAAAPTAPTRVAPAAPSHLAFAAAPASPNGPDGRSGSKRPRYLRALLSLVLLATVALLAAGLLQQRAPQSAPPPPAPAPAATTEEPSPTPTPSPTSTPTTESPTPTPSGTDSAPASGPTWAYLVDQHPVVSEMENVGGCTDNCTGVTTKPDTIAGNMYPRNVVIPLRQEGYRITVTWNAYTRCTTFEATIGIDDTSPSLKARFQLEREGGKAEDLGVLATGQSKHITVDLTGVYRYKIAAYLTAPVRSYNQAAVWGDARMLCTGLPSASPQP